MSRTDEPIWHSTIVTLQGTSHAYSTHKMLADSIRIDIEAEEVVNPITVVCDIKPTPVSVLIPGHTKTDQQIPCGALHILMQLLLDDAKNNILYRANPKVVEHFSVIRGGFSGPRSHIQARDIWTIILSFAIGFNAKDLSAPLKKLGTYGLYLRNPLLLQPKLPNLFPVISFHPDDIIEAILHGNEEMLKNMLSTNPDLLKVGTGVDLSGRKFTGNALHAAIAATDLAHNSSSTGLVELIAQQLKREDFEKQARIIYKKSLSNYLQKLEAKIMALEEAKSSGRPIDVNELNNAILRAQAYSAALSSNDLITIIIAHTAQDEETPDAQKDNVLQVDPALINAIANASDTDIQAIVNDSTINSPLSILLRQFKADFIKLSHEEIIYNPQHLLKIFALYITFYTRVAATDQSWMKRDFFWDNLVEFVMCYLPANTAQIFANPGLYEFVENNTKNIRSFDFKYGGERIFPPIVSPLDPLNIKLPSVGSRLWGSGSWAGGEAVALDARASFKTYVEQKQQAFRTLCAAVASARPQESVRSFVT